MKLKKLLCIVLVIFMLPVMAACTAEEETGDKVTITFFGWGDAEEQDNYQTLVNQFMKENPNITVVYTGESATTYMTKLKNSANQLPDLFYMPDYDFLEWVNSGLLKDITSLVSEDALSKIWPQAVEEYYYHPDDITLGKSDGARLYGLPKDLGPFTLVYNKDLLDAKINEYKLNADEVYGLLDAKTPMTWAQFRTLLKQLDPDGNDDKVFGISHYEIEAAVYSNDADFFNEDAIEQRITDKNFTDAIQFIADLCLVDNVMPTAAQQVSTNGYQRFKGKGSIFSFMGPWDAASFWKTVNFDYDILPVPYNGANPNAKSTAWVGSMAYCISNKASTKKTAAALKLAEYLCLDDDGQRTFYSLGQQVPNIISMATDEYLNDTKGLLADKNPPSRGVWLDTIDGYSDTDRIGGKVRARYYTFRSDWYNNGLLDMFTNSGMWKGTVTAAQACGKYAATFQAELNEMSANLGR